MIKENLQTRREKMDFEIGNLCYRRMKILKEMEEIDKKIAQYEGAIIENESVRRDVGSEEAINQAKMKEEETNNV